MQSFSNCIKILVLLYLGGDPGEVLRVGDPVVVLERVHRLQDGRDAPHVRVDLRVRQELRGQVRVELHLRVARWQNLIPSFPWIAPGWRAWGHNPRKGRDQILQRSVAEP